MGRPIKINLWTGASVAEEVDRTLTEAGMIARRLPFQSERAMREAINRGVAIVITDRADHFADVAEPDEGCSITVSPRRATQVMACLDRS